jgi:hypothetical protein
MTELDTTLRQSVFDIVNEFGKEITFDIQTGAGMGTYSAATGNRPVGSAGSAVAVTCSPPEDLIESYGEDEPQLRSTVRIIVPALDLDSDVVAAMQAGLEASFDDRFFIVHHVRSMYSGDELCAYQLDMNERGKS